MEKGPVCGMLVDPRQAAGQRQYQQKTYYLCCLDRFDQAPQRYVPTDKLETGKRGREINCETIGLTDSPCTGHLSVMKK